MFSSEVFMPQPQLSQELVAYFEQLQDLFDYFGKLNHAPDLGDRIEKMKQQMLSDRDYAWSWHCAIAMAAYDEGVDIDKCQRIAKRFMQMWFAVENYEPLPEDPCLEKP